MLLDIRQLEVSFSQHGRELCAVNGIDLKICEKEILAVVGESGAGKSQAFLAITRLVEQAEIRGEAWLRGKDILALSENALRTVRGGRIAYVFQDAMSALNPYLRIGTQLLEVVARHRNLDGAAARDLALDMLKRVRIPEGALRLRQFPHQLSGGQRQRVMLAMALLGQPDLLIADEPTTALDVTVQRQVLDLLQDLQQELGFSLVLITHDLGVVARIAQRVAVMYGGRIVESGTVEEIFFDARHPYTRGLLAAAPRLSGALPKPIPGVPPSADRLPQGCPFAPRCGHRDNRCQRLPGETSVSESHTCRCFLEQAHG